MIERVVAVDGRPLGLLGLSDPIKGSTAEALRFLREEGLKLVMVTGDHPATALAVVKVAPGETGMPAEAKGQG